MKMVKKTLVAIALVAFLAISAPADDVTPPVTDGAFDIFYFGPSQNGNGVKVEGDDTVYWPYEYKALDICTIPVRIQVGMYVEVEDCKQRKLIWCRLIVP
jgi:hypothetical protein